MNQKILTSVIALALLATAPAWGQTSVIKRTPQKSPKPVPKKEISLTKEYYFEKGSNESDMVKALDYYRKAADMGHAEALFKIGQFYEEGNGGVKKSESEAFNWYKLSADKNCPFAYEKVAQCYAIGKGTSYSYNNAMLWYNKLNIGSLTLSKKYWVNGCFWLNRAKEKDNNVYYAESIKWLQASSNGGNPNAMYELAKLYSIGKGINQNNQKSLRLIREAAEKGHAEAQYVTGRKYEIGEDYQKNEREAVKWYKQAADQGNADAQARLSDYYIEGKGGITKDYGKAIDLIKKSVAQNNAYGMNNMGNMLLNGYGITKNEAEAFKWYQKAAEHGLEAAFYNLGFCYYYGYGVERNEDESEQWMKKAVDNGYLQAKKFIADNLGMDIKIFVYKNVKNRKEALEGIAVSLIKETRGKKIIFINRKGEQTTNSSYQAITDSKGLCTLKLKNGDWITTIPRSKDWWAMQIGNLENVEWDVWDIEY